MPLPLLNYLAFSVCLHAFELGALPPLSLRPTLSGACLLHGRRGLFRGFRNNELGWPIPLAVLASPLVGALFAFVPAIGLRKAPGFTTAIASLSLIFIIQTVIMNLPFVGGQMGMFGIPPLEHPLTTVFVVLVIAGVIVYRIDHSRVGRAAELISYSAEDTACVGVNMARISMSLQVLSGALSGIAGSLYALTVGSVFPDAFSFSMLLLAFSAVFVGGSLTMWGCLVFAPLLWGFPLVLPEAIAEWKDIIYGAILICILIVRPEGVIDKETVAASAWRCKGSR